MPPLNTTRILDPRRANWEIVLARPRAWTPFNTLEWHLASARLAGRKPELHEFTSDHGPLAVIALTCDSSGTLTLAGDPALTDYPGPAHAPDDGALVGYTLLQMLALRPNGGDRLVLRNLRAGQLLASLTDCATTIGGLTASVTPDETAMTLRLPVSWHAYEQALSRKARHELRRKRARFATIYPDAHLRLSTPDTFADDFAIFAGLFRQSTQRKRTFFSDAVERFFRDVGESFLARGWLRLHTLESGGQPLAATFGFAHGDTFWLYNTAYLHATRAASPGVVLMSRIIEQAISQRYATFDFMRGTEPYKARFGAQPVQLWCVTIS